MKELRDRNNDWVDKENEMVVVAQEYFKELFTTSSVSDCEHVLSDIQPCILENMNEDLTAEFQVEEIMEAVKSIMPLKASSMDGFPTLFYQKY